MHSQNSSVTEDQNMHVVPFGLAAAAGGDDATEALAAGAALVVEWA